MKHAVIWPVGPTRWIRDRTLYVSIPFTWNLPDLARDFRHTDMEYDRIVVGGPAAELMPDFFKGNPSVSIGHDSPGVLQRINPLATRTTTGCPNKCGFCAVPKIEQIWRELDDWQDLPVICDNNLLASSEAHFNRVMDRLERWKWCDFNQGLDARLLTNHHARRIGRVRGAIARLAFDSMSVCDEWFRAAELLKKHGTAKSRIRSYVLCGFNDSPSDAWERCMMVEKFGAKPCPQWYHALDQLEPNSLTMEQANRNWTKAERIRLMRRFYKHTDGARHKPGESSHEY